MSKPLPADNFAPLVEFVEELGMIPDRRPVLPVCDESGEPLLITDEQTSATSAADQTALPLGELRQFFANDQLLQRVSARQLYALFTLAGGNDDSLRDRLGNEVARRRQTDPSNYHLRMLADELRR